MKVLIVLFLTILFVTGTNCPLSWFVSRALWLCIIFGFCLRTTHLAGALIRGYTPWVNTSILVSFGLSGLWALTTLITVSVKVSFGFMLKLRSTLSLELLGEVYDRLMKGRSKLGRGYFMMGWRMSGLHCKTMWPGRLGVVTIGGEGGLLVEDISAPCGLNNMKYIKLNSYNNWHFDLNGCEAS